MKECIQCRQRKVNWIMFLQWNRVEQDADLEESGSGSSERQTFAVLKGEGRRGSDFRSLGSKAGGRNWVKRTEAVTWNQENGAIEALHRILKASPTKRATQ